MAKSIQLRMVPLRVPQVGLRAFQDKLMAVKLGLLLWGWNWVCPAMVREWLRERNQPPRDYRSHPERWQVSDWEQVLGRCAGEEGDLLFECESVQVTKEEEIPFGALFKNCKSSKNRYKTRDYKDRKRRNVAVALLQILQPHRTTYMTSWHVGFVELALAGTPIHWARILWKATRQHAQEEKEGYVKDVEVDTDPDEAPASTPPARPRADDKPRGARAVRKRKWDEEADRSQREVPTALVRRRVNNKPASRPHQKTRKLVLPADSSADTVRAAVTRDSPSSEENVSAKVLGRSADLPARKARVPSEEARKPLGHRRRHAATANMPTMERCLPSEQVLFDDSPSAQASLAQTPLEQVVADEGREGKTRVPSAQTPSALDAFVGALLTVAVRASAADPLEASSPTPLEVLA
ncbi:hypothetical protein AXG93_2587s1710 [Marchantia polymorpha subsp. ruderalis]|uniref:Uncharacterized protein n=1 Tax=Marchantia polymorpha subsp. ruderalis TaxID=1480154 RepID=A0A176WSF8_MARPO|nr:hypothetical protein AXG93_2587s1710 [Marchantia polymorpha subsp. ruderalis]